jgi:protein-S-isoprenylcysteine O-methyltransferase Ste14
MTEAPVRAPLRELIGPIVGTIVFFFLAPCTVGFWVPWWMTRWQMGPPLLGWWVLRPVGAVLALVGLMGLAESFSRFARQGLGTPAPVMPPKRLVVTGLYRYGRNPMYVAVLAIILGQALLLGRRRLLVYAAVVWVVVHLFVRLYEEPVLRARFGADYAAYCATVRRWWPRLHPWRAGS